MTHRAGMLVSRIVPVLGLLMTSVLTAERIEGRVSEVYEEGRLLQVVLTSASNSFAKGERMVFRVGAGDHRIGYQGRLVTGNAVFYSQRWHLESIFPIDGSQSKIVQVINQQLQESTATKTRRKALRQGDYIPNFGMLDQFGRFVQIKQFRGKPFVLNFIFTRCTVPEMCPASTTKMVELQAKAAANGWDALDFVSITLDPAYDSPGILNEYMEAFAIAEGNFHLLTQSNPSVIEDLLYQFGILTRDENNTITHTITTFLIDPNGKIVYAKEGPRWSVDAFLEAAQPLMD